jgi:hypothetical protein
MKKLIPLVLFALLPLLYSCVSGSNQPNLPPPPQSITALKNGKSWTGTPIDSAVKDSLIVHAVGPDKDVLRMKFISLRTGTFALSDTNGQYYTTNSTGQIVNRYKLDKTANNTIILIDNVTPNYVYGQFTLTFRIYSSTTNVDTAAVSFTNGKFTLRAK